MSDNDLIRRGDALKLMDEYVFDVAYRRVAALPAVTVGVRPLVWGPTSAQTASACLSYRHDFGLMDAAARESLMFTAREWLHAWQKKAAALTTAPAPDAAAIRAAALLEALNSLPENDGDDHDEYDLVGSENIGKQRGVEACRSAILALIPTAKGGE